MEIHRWNAEYSKRPTKKSYFLLGGFWGLFDGRNRLARTPPFTNRFWSQNGSLLQLKLKKGWLATTIEFGEFDRRVRLESMQKDGTWSKGGPIQIHAKSMQNEWTSMQNKLRSMQGQWKSLRNAWKRMFNRNIFTIVEHLSSNPEKTKHRNNFHIFH